MSNRTNHHWNSSTEHRTCPFTAASIFVLLLSIYLLTVSAATITDVGDLRNEVIKSIIERHELTVLTGNGIRGYDGREYSMFSLGSVLVAIPFYAAAKLTGNSPEIAVHFINQLASASTAVLVFIFSLRLGYSRKSSVMVSIFFALGSVAWYYSKDHGDHALETFFVLSSVYFMYRHGTEKRTLFFFLSVLSLGWAFLTRPNSVLILPALILLMLPAFPQKLDFRLALKKAAEKTALFTLLFLPFLCTFFWYNYYRFGSILETGYTLMSARLGISFFNETAFMTGLEGFLFSPGKGFFFYSPIAVLCFFALKPFMKRHALPTFAFLLIILSYLIFYSKYIYWHGDHTWGPRYIFTVTPFFIIPIAALLESVGYSAKGFYRTAVHSIFCISLAIQLAAVSVNNYKYFIWLQAEKKVKFVVAEGKGTQRIILPPEALYFDWKMSPILAQFKFVGEISRNMGSYRYTEPSPGASDAEKTMSQPWMNLFDFWWLYRYLLTGSSTALMGALCLVVLAILSASRLYRTIHDRA